MGSPHEAATKLQHRMCVPERQRGSNGVSPSGKAAGFESAIRWFESSHPRENVSPYALRADVFFWMEDENQRSWRRHEAGGGNAATGCRGGVPVRIQPPQKTLSRKAEALRSRVDAALLRNARARESSGEPHDAAPSRSNPASAAAGLFQLRDARIERRESVNNAHLEACEAILSAIEAEFNTVQAALNADKARTDSACQIGYRTRELRVLRIVHPPHATPSSLPRDRGLVDKIRRRGFSTLR